jgi:hypothetical protein
MGEVPSVDPIRIARALVGNGPRRKNYMSAALRPILPPVGEHRTASTPLGSVEAGRA